MRKSRQDHQLLFFPYKDISAWRSGGGPNSCCMFLHFCPAVARRQGLKMECGWQCCRDRLSRPALSWSSESVTNCDFLTGWWFQGYPPLKSYMAMGNGPSVDDGITYSNCDFSFYVKLTRGCIPCLVLIVHWINNPAIFFLNICYNCAWHSISYIIYYEWCLQFTPQTTVVLLQ